MTKSWALTLGFLTIIVFTSHAQLKLGGKASYTQSFIKLSEQLYDDSNDYVIYRLELQEQKLLPTIGFVAYYEFYNRFNNRSLSAYIQTELLYSFRKTRFKFENYNPGEIPLKIINKSTSYLRVPIIGGFHYSKFKFGFGPIFSFQLHNQIAFTEIPLLEERAQLFEPAASLLVGATFENLVLDLSYEYHFNGISESIFYRNQIQGFTNQPNYLSLNVTYLVPYKTRF